MTEDNTLEIEEVLATPEEVLPEHEQIFVPEMTKERYAELVGVTPRTVDGWIDRGYLPTIKIGKYRMINIAQRTYDCADDGRE